MAELMVEKRKDLGADPWIRELAWDKVDCEEIPRYGQLYRHYRLRKLAKDFFAERPETLGEVQVEELVPEHIRSGRREPLIATRGSCSN